MNPWRSLIRLITTIDKIWCPSCIEVGCTFNDTLLLGKGLNMIPLIATQTDKKDVLEQRWGFLVGSFNLYRA